MTRIQRPLAGGPRYTRARECEEILAMLRAQGVEPLHTSKAIFERYIAGELTFGQMQAAIRRLGDKEGNS
jgi:hypothetical protein